jgi:hypothetical protein
MTHDQVLIGNSYDHKLEGRLWRVRITHVFEDRLRWGWEGIIAEPGDNLDGTCCWGWVSELHDPQVNAV